MHARQPPADTAAMSLLTSGPPPGCQTAGMNTSSSIPSPGVEVVHNTAEHRFETRVDGLLCVADYHLTDGPAGRVMHMTHTGVPRPLEGRGIAAALVGQALQWAREQGHKVNPACSYVRTYMQRHRETQDLLAR